MSHEEFKSVAQLSAEIGSIHRMIEAQNREYAERRQEDDRRAEVAEKSRQELTLRIDRHGNRMTAMETNWVNFFGPEGAFTYVKNKIEGTDRQNRWIIALVITTLIGVIVNLSRQH